MNIPLISCPKCGGLVERVEDVYGPYLHCYLGCWQQDLRARESPLGQIRQWRGTYYTKQALDIPQSPFFNVQARPKKD